MDPRKYTLDCPQKAIIEVPWGKTIVSLHVLTHRRASEDPKGPLWDRFTHSYCGPARGHFWDSLDFLIFSIMDCKLAFIVSELGITLH